MVITNFIKELESNPNVQKEIRSCIIETFSDIFRFLGDRNFKRWLFQSHLSSVMRKTIYKVISEENDKYFQEGKGRKGYVSVDDEKRTLVLRKGDGENKRIASHECFHLLVDADDGFNIFFSEGITEFLSEMLYNQKSKAYPPNVRMVSLLYEMYSDKLIQAYFLRNGDVFFDNLAYESSNYSRDNYLLEKMLKNNQIIDKIFTNLHCKLWNKNESKNISDDSTPQELFEKGRDVLLENYVYYLKSKIRNFDYIKDGKVEFDRFLLDISKVFLNAIFINEPSKNVINEYIINVINPCVKDLSSELIENSHLLYDCKDDKDRLNLKVQILQDMTSVFNGIVQAYQKDQNILDYANFNQDREPYISLNTDQALKLADTFLISDLFEKRTDLLNLLNRVNLISRATNMNEMDLDVILSKFAIEYTDDPKKFIRVAETYAIATNNLQQLKYDYDRDFSDVNYKRIFSSCFGDRLTYFERRDDKYSIMMIDEKTGDIEKLPLERGDISIANSEFYVEPVYRFSKNQLLPEDMKDDLAEGLNVYRIINYGESGSTYISFDEEFDILKLSNGKIDEKVMGFMDIKKECLSMITSISDRKDDDFSLKQDVSDFYSDEKRKIFLSGAIEVTKEVVATGDIEEQRKKIINIKENFMNKENNSKNI